MTRRPTLIQTAGAAGLAVGLAIGGYGFASAASPGPTPPPPPPPPSAPGPSAPAAPGKGARPGLAAAASAIGMPVADLEKELAAGKTIAAVAAEHHVDASKVIDAMVAEAQPGLRQRITAEVNGQFGVRGPKGPMGPFGRGAELGVAATTLHMTPADLKTALAGGQTLAQIAQSKGVDPQKLIDALVADRTAKLDQAVKDGKLTQAQEDRLKATLSKRVTDEVNGHHPAWGRPRPGGTGQPGGPGQSGGPGQPGGPGAPDSPSGPVPAP